MTSGEIAAAPWLAAVLNQESGRSRRPRPAGDQPVTARELEVISLVAEGLSNKEVARRLGIREQTVKNHLVQISKKLGVSSRLEIGLEAVRHHVAVRRRFLKGRAGHHCQPSKREEKTMIAVMGATGNTGGVISERLLESGAGVRVLGRSADKLAALVEKGAEAAVGEASDAGYLASAFRGADAVYTLIPPNLQADDYSAFQDRAGEAITQAIRESGVRHVVFLSSIGADQPEGTGPIAGLYRQEGRLRSLEGVNVLALRPAYFFENHLYTLGLIQHQGINGGAIAPDVPMAMIATRDIAEAAASELLARDSSGFTVRELLGPRDLTMAEATRIIGEKIGKPDLQYVQFPYGEFEASLTQMGLSGSVAGLTTEMARAFNDGKIRSLEGRSPANTTLTSFEAFADVLAQAYQAA